MPGPRRRSGISEISVGVRLRMVRRRVGMVVIIEIGRGGGGGAVGGRGKGGREAGGSFGMDIFTSPRACQGSRIHILGTNNIYLVIFLSRLFSPLLSSKIRFPSF